MKKYVVYYDMLYTKNKIDIEKTGITYYAYTIVYSHTSIDLVITYSVVNKSVLWVTHFWFLIFDFSV